MEAKAVQFVEPRRVEIVEFEPSAPGPGQVAVRMLASSLCNHPELQSYRGGQPAGYGSHYPMALGEPGHEGIGAVADVGEGVALQAGDLVAMTGHGGDPTHRSVVIKDADTLAVIRPDGRDPAAASILEMFGCAYHCVRAGWTQPPGFDDARVAVIGVGAIGLCCVQILRLWPVRELLALDVRSDKLELATRLGATRTLQVPEEAEPEALAEELGTFDLVVECSGHRSGHLLANALAERAIINVSFCAQPYRVKQARWFARGTTVYNPGILSSDELRAVAALYNRRLIDPEPMVSRRIAPDPEQYVDSIRAIERGEVIKALIQWDAP